MSQRSAVHATFVIERTYDATPARVFKAWAEPEAKASWFGPKVLTNGGHELDFKVGGEEHLRVLTPDGATYLFDSRYEDIVPEERIVYAYDMHKDDARISVSLTTVVLEPSGAGTKLTFTEQGVFLDGHDTPAEREHGTGELLDNLGAELGKEPS
ncbi:MAG: SRPBCC family protein [Solirubrobacteraceae bacterium]